MGRAVGFVVVILALAVVAGFFTLNNYIYKEKQGEGNTFEPYRAELSGRYACLPPKDTSGEVTTECAYGLQTEAGEYYAIDFNLMSLAHQNILGGSYLSASGTVTPIERLSTDRFSKYDIEGVFSVTDSLEVRPPLPGENMEGEADPSRMTLGMTKWNWISAQYNDGRKIVPKKQGSFTLSFKDDGTFSASTDCNGVGGEYVEKNGAITLSRMMSTLMYCEGSQEAEFSKLLQDTSGYHFTSRGELILDLKFDSGTVVFR